MMSVMTATESAPAGKTKRSAVQGDAADGHSGQSICARHSARRGRPCGGQGMRLERRRIDRAERDIVGFGGKRRLQLVSRLWVLTPSLILAVLMAREIGACQILLAEMHEARAGVDGLLPIVVDHELAAMGTAERAPLSHLCALTPARLVLDAKLHQSDAVRQAGGRAMPCRGRWGRRDRG